MSTHSLITSHLLERGIEVQDSQYDEVAWIYLSNVLHGDEVSFLEKKCWLLGMFPLMQDLQESDISALVADLIGLTNSSLDLPVSAENIIATSQDQQVHDKHGAMEGSPYASKILGSAELQPCAETAPVYSFMPLADILTKYRVDSTGIEESTMEYLLMAVNEAESDEEKQIIVSAYIPEAEGNNELLLEICHVSKVFVQSKKTSSSSRVQVLCVDEMQSSSGGSNVFERILSTLDGPHYEDYSLLRSFFPAIPWDLLLFLFQIECDCDKNEVSQRILEMNDSPTVTSEAESRMRTYEDRYVDNPVL